MEPMPARLPYSNRKWIPKCKKHIPGLTVQNYLKSFYIVGLICLFANNMVLHLENELFPGENRYCSQARRGRGRYI